MTICFNKGAKALDVGSGSGYLTACFAVMVTNQYLFANNLVLSDIYARLNLHAVLHVLKHTSNTAC